MTTETSGWRTLTAEELASEPEARLGGELAVIFYAAAAIAVLAVLLLVVSLTPLVPGPQASVVGGAFAVYQSLRPLLLYLPHALWATAFVVATLARADWGPRITSILYVIGVLASSLSNTALLWINDPAPHWFTRLLIRADGLLILLLQLVIAVAFWAYMHEGRRPNLYFRRRLRV